MQILFLLDNRAHYEKLQQIINRIAGPSMGNDGQLTNAGLPAGTTPDLLFMNLHLTGAKCTELIHELQNISRQELPEDISPGHSRSAAGNSSAFHTRFISKLGGSIRSVAVADIAYFFTENKLSYLCTKQGRKLPVDFNLDQIEKKVDPKIFFRINRQFIIGHHAIAEMKAHTRSRIIVQLSPPHHLDTTVALDRASEFRKWISE